MFGIDILKIHYWVFVRSGVKQCPEVWTANTQNQFVSLEDLSPAGQGDVAELLGATQVLHDGEKARMVIIPLQQKFFLRHFSSGLLHKVDHKGCVNVVALLTASMCCCIPQVVHDSPGVS